MTDTARNELLWREYREYASKNQMSRHERALLHDWVKAGHGVHEPVDSEYLPGPTWPPMDYLTAYRFDRSIADEIDGLTEEERLDYFQENLGFSLPDHRNLELEETKRTAPPVIEARVRQLKRDLFHLWEFIWSEGLGDEAQAFVESRKDDEIPFEW